MQKDVADNHGHSILRTFAVLPIFLSPQVKRSYLINCNKLIYTSCLTSCPTT